MDLRLATSFAIARCDFSAIAGNTKLSAVNKHRVFSKISFSKNVECSYLVKRKQPYMYLILILI